MMMIIIIIIIIIIIKNTTFGRRITVFLLLTIDCSLRVSEGC
jgi:hypothetical protein